MLANAMAWENRAGRSGPMKTSGCRKSPSAHMQARGDTEGRDAVEGGEGMKSTRRFKAALAAVLVLALSPLFGGAALSLIHI